MSQPPAAGPDFSPPGFAPCYRHPERSTGISCQRCHRPICGECMQPASVGFQCPRCVAGGRARSRAPRTTFGASIQPNGARATIGLMIALGAVWLIDLVTPANVATSLLAMNNGALYAGELWRLVTAPLTSGGLLALSLNLLVLWLAGRALESEFGRWRFLVLYFGAGLGGATVFFLLGPPYGATLGASAAIIGLLTANGVFKYKSREDVRGDVGLLVLLVLLNIVVGFDNFGWLTLLGGIAFGGIVGAVLAYAPRRSRTAVQIVGLLGVVLVCLAAVVAKLLVGWS